MNGARWGAVGPTEMVETTTKVVVVLISDGAAGGMPPLQATLGESGGHRKISKNQMAIETQSRAGREQIQARFNL